VGSSPRDLNSSNRSVAFFTPPIYAAEHIEGSRARSQTGACSNNSRNGCGEDLETNPTSDHLWLVFNNKGSEDRILQPEGGSNDIGERVSCSQYNGLAAVDSWTLLLGGSTGSIGELEF
jgi:hypothetical protein